MHKIIQILILFTIFTNQSIASPPAGALESEIQDIKKQVLDINRDLFILEEELLYPSNTQFSVFLSVDSGKLFVLDSVQIRIDDKVVANHLYTDRETEALRRGGVQRIYIGNIASGKHELVAYFVGQGPNNRDYRRATTQVFEKSPEPLFLELKIIDNTTKEQPEFDVKIWE